MNAVSKRSVIGLAVVFAMSITFLFAEKAMAVPAFAKQQGAECTLCHVGFPKLNETGIKFRINGYRMDGDVGENIWEQDLKNHIGVVAGTNYVNKDMEMPMPPMEDAGAGDGGAEHRESAQSDMNGTMKVKTSQLEMAPALIYFAGTLAPRISYFTHLVASSSSTVLALSNFSILDVAPDAALNIRAGVTNVDLPYLSSSRRLTMSDYLVQLSGGAAGHGGGGHGGAGLNSCTNCGVSMTKAGADVNGLVSMGDNMSLEYVLGLGNNGVGETEQKVDSIYGYATLNIGGQSIGFIFNNDKAGDNENVEQDVTAYGISGDFNFADFNIMATYNILTQAQAGGDDVETSSGALEGSWTILENIIGVVRYDFSDIADSDVAENQIIASFLYYLNPNVRLQAELASNTATDHSGTDRSSTGIYGGATIGF
ncbi:hypothetical protein MNBD_NITROSPINAE02-448 [hydrothermal vent metagenome]|uniref:Porin domain-containing protein n=1 Tax=hydrothermal vent metagenome TaxID=652676 RepID=A0A3B1C264_9ZZZZ